MYKRETRYKGQKRVSVGRITRNSDPLDIKPKDRSSLREESDREWPYEDASSTIKSFNNGSVDPTVPDIQMNDDMREREESMVRKSSISILIFSLHSFLSPRRCHQRVQKTR